MSLMAIRAIIIYLFVLVVIRLMGKRQIGEMQPFELVITLIIADLACIPMAEVAVPLGHGLIPIFTLLVIHFLICVLSRKSMWARYLVSGRPAIVITPQGINFKELKTLNMTLDDLIESMRGCGFSSVDEVAYAIIETNGKMCCIPAPSNAPATKTDVGVETTKAGFPVNLIMDGKVMKENFEMCGVGEKIINNILSRAKLKNVKDVLLLTLDNNGKVFVQGKNVNKYSTFSVEYGGGGKW
ncbi:MAG: DUF421 domain-containing protein [Clostridia bacterium]|nr:DUF421 domain-containing protein [Clostridia bacterium]